MLPHAYKLWKKSVHDPLSEICISESTPPTVTKRASQFRRPLLRRKGAQLNITSHFPPLAQLRGYNPFLCRTAAEASAAVRRRRHRGERDCTPLSYPRRTAAVEAVRPPPAVQQLRRCTPGAELPPKLSGCSGGCPPRAEKSGGGSSPDFSPPLDCR